MLKEKMQVLKKRKEKPQKRDMPHVKLEALSQVRDNFCIFIVNLNRYYKLMYFSRGFPDYHLNS